MGSVIRIILLIASIAVTLVLFVYHLILFNKYVKRGKYQYENFHNRTFMVVKEGFGKENCTLIGTTFRHGEVDWLIIRSKGHFVFLFCFWGALVLALLASIVGSILEYMFKDSIHGCGKILRVLRSTLYKSSMSIPVMVLFVFNYATPCLQLKETTFMVFSNQFTYIIVAILFPILAIIFLDVVYEFYVWKPNATYILVKGSMKNQSVGTKAIQLILYSILFMIIVGGIVFSFLIYLELFLLTHITHHILVMFNIALSILSICCT